MSCLTLDRFAFTSVLKDGMTVLHYAAEGGHMDLCLKLVEMGADVTATNEVSVLA